MKQQPETKDLLLFFPSPFNKQVMLAMVAPITSMVRGHGFEVPLNGKKIEGVVLRYHPGV